MDAVTVDRARLRLRLPESELRWRSTISALHERVIRSALELARTEEGSSEALVCVRCLAVELRLEPSELGSGTLESAAARRWKAALIAELRRALREQDPQQVVRYPSPVAALVDMGRGLARQDLRRVWAWAQLGFVDALTPATASGSRLDAGSPSLSLEAARRGFVRALLRRPELCVGVVVQLAREPSSLARLVRAIPAQAWLELSVAATGAHGSLEAREPVLASTGLERGSLEREGAPLGPERGSLGREPSVSWMLELAGCSTIFRALASPVVGDVDPRTRAALLRLAVLEAAPMTARRLAKISAPVEREATKPPPSREPSEAALEPASEPLSPWRDRVEDARARARSEWGGLLLLLAILRDEQLWDALDELALELELEPRAVVHGFGRVLVAEPIEPDDPALLAFIGLPPDARPPAELDPARAQHLLGALAGARGRLLAALDERLPDRPERGPALLAWLLRRRAELVGEPGWIEVHLDLREVDLDVRRAGLDLDPDWIPELGVVMRFVYD